MRFLALGPASLLSAGLLAFACSSEDATSSPTAASDAGPSSADAEASAPVVLPPTPKTGKIGAVFANSDVGLDVSYSVGGSFVDVTAADTSVTEKKVGPCIIETYGNGTPAKETVLSAGALKLTGGIKDVTVQPAGDKTYTPVKGKESLWAGGETLSVDGAGADAPAFKLSVTAPPKVVMSAPTLGAGGAGITVTRASGLTAKWAATSSGTVVLYFDATSATNAYAATCEFPATAGQATVPAEAFADFPAGSGTFNFYVKEAAVATPGDWTIRFTASSVVVDAAGTYATGDAMFD